jgi:IS6 family transposase
VPPSSAFAGHRFPPEVIVVAVRWYANNPIEADHGQLKHRLRPMRGLRTDRTAQVIIAGHAFMQNLRRGHYELATNTPPTRRAAAFTELALAI